tara:strand:- start:2535 stop:3911 length:1377 start_codon:yes stop_codon:yes gene_type:complete
MDFLPHVGDVQRVVQYVREVAAHTFYSNVQRGQGFVKNLFTMDPRVRRFYMIGFLAFVMGIILHQMTRSSVFYEDYTLDKDVVFDVIARECGGIQTMHLQVNYTPPLSADVPLYYFISTGDDYEEREYHEVLSLKELIDKNGITQIAEDSMLAHPEFFLECLSQGTVNCRMMKKRQIEVTIYITLGVSIFNLKLTLEESKLSDEDASSHLRQVTAKVKSLERNKQQQDKEMKELLAKFEMQDNQLRRLQEELKSMKISMERKEKEVETSFQNQRDALSAVACDASRDYFITPTFDMKSIFTSTGDNFAKTFQSNAHDLLVADGEEWYVNVLKKMSGTASKEETFRAALKLDTAMQTKLQTDLFTRFDLLFRVYQRTYGAHPRQIYCEVEDLPSFLERTVVVGKCNVQFVVCENFILRTNFSVPCTLEDHSSRSVYLEDYSHVNFDHYRYKSYLLSVSY